MEKQVAAIRERTQAAPTTESVSHIPRLDLPVLKAAHPMLLVVKCADSNRTLDGAIVFVPSGGDKNAAAQIGADAGIPAAVIEGEFELPDDFDVTELGGYWDQAYTG